MLLLMIPLSQIDAVGTESGKEKDPVPEVFFGGAFPIADEPAGFRRSDGLGAVALRRPWPTSEISFRLACRRRTPRRRWLSRRRA
jgi:hypothetical protein